MAQSVLRFAHAGHLRLDSPLRGVGPVPTAVRRLVEDAPTIAWRRLVDAGIEREAEFLLLTPRTVSSSLSLHDRRELRAGVQQLAHARIPVYWYSSDDEDDIAAWRGALSENVTWLSRSEPSATFIRHGRVAATIHVGDSPPESPRTSETLSVVADRPLRIWIPADGGSRDRWPSTEACRTNVAADYVAGWGSARAQTQLTGATVWADPGTPLGRSADEPGGGGVTFVEWVPGEAAELQRVPTASVRWERIPLGLTPETKRDDLVERLQYALLEREPAIGEQFWIVDWHVVGSGPLFGELQAEATRSAVEQAVESALGDGERLKRVHRWKLIQRSTPRAGDDVALRVQEWLDRDGKAACPKLCADLPTAFGRRSAEWIELTPHLHYDSVRDEAQRFLAEWLSGSAEDAEPVSRA